ncbi:hypothetical protein Tco_1508160 [Tanacetum coccineum]
MAQLKYCDKHNQVGFLLKPTESAGYTEIVDFLRRSKLRYALTHNPPIYDSLVKQFWQTATARTLADGTQQLNATIDSIEYTITEESVRRQLQLADASGINMLQNEEIFEGLQNIGSKSGGWDQFGSNIATALICLSTGRDFNFSKLIFDGMISNLKSKSKFLMYPRFLQMILNVQTENKNLFVPVLLTKKIFGNMKRSFQGIHRPLLPAMLTIDAGQPQPSAVPTSSQPVQSTSPPPQPSSAQPTSSPHPIQPAQPTSSPHPIQPVQTTSPPPITTIPDIQPTLPPSPQIPSPSYHDTEGMSKKLENQLRKKRKSEETKKIGRARRNESCKRSTATELTTSSTTKCRSDSLQKMIQQERKGAISIEDKAKVFYMKQLLPKGSFLQNKGYAASETASKISQLRNQMITYLKHVANKKHAELKSKSFEEIQVLYERYKKQDQTFVAIGSEEDERAIKKMNEKDIDKEKEQKKKKQGKKVILSMRKLNRNKSNPKPDEDIYLNKVTRTNGHQRFFRTLMGVLSILDREDLKVIYELVMEKYQDDIPEGFDKMLWGDLMIMFNQGDTADFWDEQLDWKIIS